MIHTTQWSPDTCDCVVEFTWDDSVPQESRTYDFVRRINACPAHSATSGASGFATLLEQNQRKNKSRAMFLEELGTIIGAIDPQSGSIDFKPGIELSWSWQGEGENRVLYVTLIGIALTPVQKRSVQDRLDVLFGAGKVVVQ